MDHATASSPRRRELIIVVSLAALAIAGGFLLKQTVWSPASIDVALGLMKDMTYPDIDDPEALISAMRMDLDDGSEEAMARRRRVANSAILDRDELQDVYRGWRRVMDEYDRDAMAVAEAWVPPGLACNRGYR